MRTQSSAVFVLRWVFASLFAVVAALSVPATVIAHWMKEDVLNTSRFVNLLEPLSQSASFQSRLAEAAAEGVSTAVAESEALDTVQSLASSATDLIDLLPFGTDLLGSASNLTGEVETQVYATVEQQTLAFLQSSAFPPVWSSAVSQIHKQAIGALSTPSHPGTDADSVATLSIQIGPMVEIVKEALSTDGQWWARLIPDVNKEVEVAELHDLATLQRYYRFFENAAGWALGGGIAAAVIAIALAPRRLLVIGGGALVAFGATAVAWSGVSNFGAQHLQVITDEGAAAMSQQVWGLLTSPLITALQRGGGTALIVAIAALAVALVLYVVRGRPTENPGNSTVTGVMSGG